MINMSNDPNIYEGKLIKIKNVLCNLVHSFIQAISVVSEFHAEAPQATASKGPYVATRAGFEPETAGTKGVESTNEPPRPTQQVRPRQLNRINVIDISL